MESKKERKHKKTNDSVINQYHLLAAPKCLDETDLKNSNYRKDFNQKNKEFKAHLVAFSRKGFSNSTQDQVSKEAFYLHDQQSMKTLASCLKDNDELVLHGEGQPFVIGLSEPGYEISPYGFAMLLAGCGVPDVKIKIILLACNSATNFNDINFAQNTSEALSFLGYKNIKVAGYTGFVSDKDNGKFSVSSIVEDGRQSKNHTKNTHASLENAERIYLNGRMIQEAKRILMNYDSEKFDGWADKYIKKAGEDKVAVKKRYKITENALKEGEKDGAIDAEVVVQPVTLRTSSAKMGLFSKGFMAENIVEEKSTKEEGKNFS